MKSPSRLAALRAELERRRAWQSPEERVADDAAEEVDIFELRDREDAERLSLRMLGAEGIAWVASRRPGDFTPFDLDALLLELKGKA